MVSGTPSMTAIALRSRYLCSISVMTALVAGATSLGFTTTQLPAEIAPERGEMAS